MLESCDIVTIDGPSGVGKSTLSRRVARELGYTYLDTGAMYRAVAFYLQGKGVSLDDDATLSSSLAEMELQLLPADQEDGDVGVVVDGRDISQMIRTGEMGMMASRVSALSVVRGKLTVMQQLIGSKGRVVAEGRDTGTVVFPNARWKFYLEANPEERARRRAEQLRLRGENVDFQELLAMIVQRDHDDQTRAIAPLCKAEDAVIIDTSSISIEVVSQQIIQLVR